MARSGDAPAGELGGLPARAGDIAALRYLLGAARRVAVTGAPGTGKSALAAAAAAAARADFPDGTWIAPLRAVTDGALVPHVVARSLGLPDELGLSQLDVLRAGLRGKRALIVLDDCDLVAGACARLAAELERCRGVHLAATAMAPPGMGGERVYAVKSALDAAATGIGHAGTGRTGAGHAGAGLAHQLSPPEQRLLWARLSVFGGWFRAADAVALCAHPPLDPGTVPEGLAGLAARSILLARQAPGGTTYRLPASARDYGAAMLRELGEEGPLLFRHPPIGA